VIHVYAVTKGLEGLPDVEGIEGVSPERFRCNGFDLVVSEQGAAVEPTEQAVLAHARVVEALLPLAEALLPARFGVAYDDEAALEEAVHQRAAQLSESLARVRCHVELGVSIVGEQRPESPPPATGRAYLEAKAAEARLGSELHEALSAHADAATRAQPLDGSIVLASAYLVDPDTIPSFLGAVEKLKEQYPELTIAVTGPWPPYSFAGVDGQ
jgi:hypothetical protein